MNIFDKFKTRAWFYPSLLTAIFLTAVIITKPLGEFALNDDWFYYAAVKGFNWSSWQLDKLVTPALMGQIFYGQALIKLFSFSFSLLRLSTLMLALAGALFFYRLLARQGLECGQAFFCSLLFLFNPLFYNLSFSFMTDVPALALAIAGLYLYYLAMTREKKGYWLAANLLIICAALIRQNYIIILPLSAVLLVWPAVKEKKIQLKPWLWFFFSLTLAAGLYVFLKQRQWWPANDIKSHAFTNWREIITNGIKQIYFIWHYLALFLAPIILSWFLALKAKQKQISLIAIVLSAALAAYLFIYHQLQFPYFGNVINLYGLGARGSNLTLTGAPSAFFNPAISLGFTLAAALSAGAFLVMLFGAIKDLFSAPAEAANRKIYYWFMIINFLAQAAIIMVFIGFDRYYLSLLIFSLILIMPAMRQIKISWLGWTLLAAMAVLAVFGTHNYLRENSLKWQIANGLTARGVKINAIDAGYEWLGWHWYGRGDPAVLPYYNPNKPWYITKLFPDNLRQYVISYDSRLKDYALIKKYQYKKLPWGNGELYLFKYKPNF